MPQIQFNGKTYNDIAEMPAMERQAYEQLTAIFKDENQDGIPDVFQGDIVGNLIKAATTTVIVDGKQVSGLGEMSPEQRARFDKGMANLKELGIISQVPKLARDSQAPTWEDSDIRASRPIIQPPSAIEQDGGNFRGVITVSVLVALLVCGIAVAALLYIRSGL